MIVWFHGGGLTGGSKSSTGDVALARRFVEKGIAVAQVEYRFSPKVKYPTYLQDAAKAVSWIVAEAPTRGLNPKAIFVGGHSAGGYISAMLALDERLLKGAGVAPGAVAGFIPVSGQMMTHFTVRSERGQLGRAVGVRRIGVGRVGCGTGRARVVVGLFAWGFAHCSGVGTPRMLNPAST